MPRAAGSGGDPTAMEGIDGTKIPDDAQSAAGGPPPGRPGHRRRPGLSRASARRIPAANRPGLRIRSSATPSAGLPSPVRAVRAFWSRAERGACLGNPIAGAPGRWGRLAPPHRALAAFLAAAGVSAPAKAVAAQLRAGPEIVFFQAMPKGKFTGGAGAVRGIRGRWRGAAGELHERGQRDPAGSLQDSSHI